MRVNPFNPGGKAADFHAGLDFASSPGTPIIATSTGKVLKVMNTTTSGYGLYVKIHHGLGYTSLYSHNRKNLVNEGAILAARRDLKVIGQDEFEEAIERVIAGPERKSRLISDEEKRIVAYHEAGHAVVAHALPEADPVHKVSIIARGMAGGYTLMLPEEDRTLMPKKKLFADMVGLLGGRAAEELVFNDITSGASNDLERVTKMARAMVTRLGMSDQLGPMVYGQKEELVFLGREISEQRDYSESIAEQIDQEVRTLVSEAHERARQILSDYRDRLDAVAERLLETETVSREEFEEIFPAPVAKNGGTPALLGA
jgi:cell division protease FtsH